MAAEQLLASFISGTGYSDLDEETVATVKRQLVAFYGALIAGSSTGAAAAAGFVCDMGGKPEATVFVKGGKVPAHQAAFANAAMGRALDIDDHIAPGAHIGGAVIPAAFAAAELAGGCSGKDFIAAVAAGTETSVRLMRREADYAGFDPTGVTAVFSSAAASSKLLGLDEAQIRNALGLASDKSGASFQHFIDGVLAGPVMQGWVAAAGVECARLTQYKITGTVNFLEGVYGYFNLFGRGGAGSQHAGGESEVGSQHAGGLGESDALRVTGGEAGSQHAGGLGESEGEAGVLSEAGCEADALLGAGCETDALRVTGGLGKEWRMKGLNFKKYPSCGNTQSSTELILNMAEEHGFTADDVARIEILMPPYAFNLVGHDFKIGENPRVDAQFNVAYCVANALMRAPVTLAHFKAEQVCDPGIASFIKEKVTVVSEPAVDRGHYSVDIRVWTKGGKEFCGQTDIPPGTPANPMTSAEHRSRFFDCVSFSGTPWFEGREEDILGFIGALEEQADVREMVRLFLP